MTGPDDTKQEVTVLWDEGAGDEGAGDEGAGDKGAGDEARKLQYLDSLRSEPVMSRSSTGFLKSDFCKSC